MLRAGELGLTLRTKILLAAEYLLLFVVLPILLLLRKPNLPPIPLLWAVALYCFLMLRRDPQYDRSELWNPQRLRGQLKPILLLFALGVVLISCLVYFFARPLLFSFIRVHPVIWALVMLLYPVLSVYPQGIIYRAFLLQRYRHATTKKWALILLSALAFSLMHIVFRNWICVTLTFPGGVLFARRHLETKSLFVSSFEHALYGCFVFTIGLGQFFFARFI